MSEPSPTETCPATPKPTLHLRKAGCASTSYVPDPPPVVTQPDDDQKKKKIKTGRAALGLAGYTLPAAWLLFLVLGGWMASIRYGGLMDLQEEFSLYGPRVILALYLVIVVMAFKEDLFTGVLCILVPGYGFYYLIRSGRPFFAALVFGLLAGLGEDSYWALREICLKHYDDITKLIAGKRK